MNFALAAQHRCGAGDYVVALDTARGRVAAAASRKVVEGPMIVDVEQWANGMRSMRRLKLESSCW